MKVPLNIPILRLQFPLNTFYACGKYFLNETVLYIVYLNIKGHFPSLKCYLYDINCTYGDYRLYFIDM